MDRRILALALAVLVLAGLQAPSASAAPGHVIGVDVDDGAWLAAPVHLAGWAEAPAGVAAVDVALRRRSDGRWLGPTGWGGYATLGASLDASGSGPRWSLDLDLDVGLYGFAVSIVDGDGTRTAPAERPWTRFGVVDDPSSTSPPGVDVVPGATQHAGQVVLAGTASGDGVEAVHVAVKDLDAGTWVRHDGGRGAYVRHAAVLDEVGGDVVGWEVTLDLAAGRYGVHALATDRHGRQTPEGQRDWTTFEVTDRPAGGPPHAASDLQSGDVLTAGMPVGGWATADRGVGAVHVALRDLESGAWLHADGGVGGYRRLSATLASPGASETRWTYDGPLPVGRWGLAVIGEDVTGELATQRPWVTFEVVGPPEPSGDPPSVTLVVPDTASAVLEVGGQAADGDGAVVDVQLTARHVVGGAWLLPDGGLGEDPVLLPVVVTHDTAAATTSWRSSIGLPAGEWDLRAIAVDDGGHLTPSQDVAVAVVEVLPADAAVSGRPTTTVSRIPDVLPPGVVRLSGAAHDDGHVEAVTVVVDDGTRESWLDPHGRIGTAGRVEALVVDVDTGAATWSLDLLVPVGTWRVTAHATDDGGLVTRRAAAGSSTFDVRDDAGLLTIQFGRSQWSVPGAGCSTDPRSFTLGEVAGFLDDHGLVAQTTVAIGHVAEAPSDRLCPFPVQKTASWDDLATLRDVHGWTAVGDSRPWVDPDGNVVRRPRIADLDPAEQHRQSCGSLDVLAENGHHRAWGLFAYAGNVVDDAVQRDIVSTCYAFGRRYGDVAVAREELGPPWLVPTETVDGGRCHDRASACATFAFPAAWESASWKGRHQRYLHPETLLQRLSVGVGDWKLVQFYRLVEDRRTPDTDEQWSPYDHSWWDCTDPDPSRHWTALPELYCADDFRWVVDNLPPSVLTMDAASVAERWGRGDPGR